MPNRDDASRRKVLKLTGGLLAALGTGGVASAEQSVEPLGNRPDVRGGPDVEPSGNRPDVRAQSVDPLGNRPDVRGGPDAEPSGNRPDVRTE